MKIGLNMNHRIINVQVKVLSDQYQCEYITFNKMNMYSFYYNKIKH